MQVCLPLPTRSDSCPTCPPLDDCIDTGPPQPWITCYPDPWCQYIQVITLTSLHPPLHPSPHPHLHPGQHGGGVHGAEPPPALAGRHRLLLRHRAGDPRHNQRRQGQQRDGCAHGGAAVPGGGGGGGGQGGGGRGEQAAPSPTPQATYMQWFGRVNTSAIKEDDVSE